MPDWELADDGFVKIVGIKDKLTGAPSLRFHCVRNGQTIHAIYSEPYNRYFSLKPTHIVVLKHLGKLDNILESGNRIFYTARIKLDTILEESADSES